MRPTEHTCSYTQGSQHESVRAAGGAGGHYLQVGLLGASGADVGISAVRRVAAGLPGLHHPVPGHLKKIWISIIMSGKVLIEVANPD